MQTRLLITLLSGAIAGSAFFYFIEKHFLNEGENENENENKIEKQDKLKKKIKPTAEELKRKTKQFDKLLEKDGNELNYKPKVVGQQLNDKK